MRHSGLGGEEGEASSALAAQAEPLQNCAIAGDVSVAQVAQVAPTLADEAKQATTSFEVVLVASQVVGQVLDPVGEQRDLNLGRACVALGLLELVDDLAFALGRLHREIVAFELRLSCLLSLRLSFRVNTTHCGARRISRLAAHRAPGPNALSGVSVTLPCAESWEQSGRSEPRWAPG